MINISDNDNKIHSHSTNRPPLVSDIIGADAEILFFRRCRPSCSSDVDARGANREKKRKNMLGLVCPPQLLCRHSCSRENGVSFEVSANRRNSRT